MLGCSLGRIAKFVLVLSHTSFACKQEKFRSRNAEFPRSNQLSILQPYSKIGVLFWCTATHFQLYLDLEIEQANLDSLINMWFLATYSCDCRSRSMNKRIVILEKIPISREMSGKDLPHLFFKNSLIFNRVYISFNWRQSSHTLSTNAPPYHDLKLILFSLFFWTRSDLHPSSLLLQLRTLSSWPIIIFVSSERITRFQLSTVHCLFPLHQTSRFLWFTSLITSFFLTITLR